jgi:hypothetical protein
MDMMSPARTLPGEFPCERAAATHTQDSLATLILHSAYLKRIVVPLDLLHDPPRPVLDFDFVLIIA